MGSIRGFLTRLARYRWTVILGLATLLVVDGMQLVIPRIIIPSAVIVPRVIVPGVIVCLDVIVVGIRTLAAQHEGHGEQDDQVTHEHRSSVWASSHGGDAVHAG